MIAYKFLAVGAVGPFSAMRWPRPTGDAPGDWVRSGAVASMCRRGVHACRVRDLPWWIAAELWRVELEGPLTVGEHKLAAPAGRLLGRVDAWTGDVAREYADACAWRARDRAVEALDRVGQDAAARRVERCSGLQELLDVSRELAGTVPGARISLTIAGDGAVRALTRAIATSAYIAAHAAGRLDGPRGIVAEREWQARWLSDRLDLEATG